MPRKRAYARIAITLPEEDLTAADRVAREQDRSRSWVIAEAVRAYTGGTLTSNTPETLAAAGLGPNRHAQLVADMRLTPVESVRAAEETVRAVPNRGGGATSSASSPSIATRITSRGKSGRPSPDDAANDAARGGLRRPQCGEGALRACRSGGLAAGRAVTIVGDIPNVDILTRAWNVKYATARPRAHVFELDGVRIPTASVEDLIESKRTGRLQDAADIETLEAIRLLRSD